MYVKKKSKTGTSSSTCVFVFALCSNQTSTKIASKLEHSHEAILKRALGLKQIFTGRYKENLLFRLVRKTVIGRVWKNVDARRCIEKC